MNPWLVVLFGAVDRNPLVHMNRGFQAKAEGPNLTLLWATLAFVAIAVLVLWLASRLIEWFQRRGPFDSPSWLFVSLCRAHRLRWRESWLLWQVARRQRLRPAARLFVDPESLDARRLAAAFPNRGAELQRLRQRLFRGLA